ncbi:hypothetical protein BN1088_1433429 [Sphingobacterium sp. PM2-P1-29]|nr:hypothetical protein BN1088_1433429 [Sphingobacterium sp. PM2-P1-29]
MELIQMPFFIFFPSYFYIVTPEVLASPISTQSKTFLVKKHDQVSFDHWSTYFFGWYNPLSQPQSIQALNYRSSLNMSNIFFTCQKSFSC